MKIRIFFQVIICTAFAGLFLTSCKKHVTPLDPARQFQTASDITITTTPTTAVLSWKEAVNTDSTVSTYTVQISQDSSFNTINATLTTSGTSITITDSLLTVRVKYYARVKTNGATEALDSKWVYSSKFSITGEQIFLVVKDVELRPTSVVLRWKDTTKAVLTKITLTPNGGAPTDYTLTQADIDSSFKKIDGLTSNMTYHAQIFSATGKEKGFLDFTTKVTPVFAFTVNPSMDLAVILDTCAPNIIIGLDTGTYLPTVTYTIKSKSVTLRGMSGNPADTKVVFKEIKLVGDGAGVNLIDLSFDGLSVANYFLNFGGLASDAAAANFANVSLSNCWVSNYTNCLMRANRGTAAGDHKIGSITVDNCIFFNNTLGSQYTEFTFDKLGIQNFSVTNSTFNKMGRALILLSSTLPASSPAPVIVFDRNTVNNFGTGSVRPIMDASANPVLATFTNNIIANVPRLATVTGPELIRATAATSVVTFSNNNYFKLNTATSGTITALTLPTTIIQANNQTIDLGWDSTTVNFTVPVTQPLLRTGSTTGGPLGDPRWF